MADVNEPFLYTEVDSRWATPVDRVRIFRLVVRVTRSYRGPEFAAGRRRAYRLAVKHLVDPRSRAAWYVTSGGSWSGE